VKLLAMDESSQTQFFAEEKIAAAREHTLKKSQLKLLFAGAPSRGGVRWAMSTQLITQRHLPLQ
jgi:hypothetical protein